MPKYKLNRELHGIELYFDSMPSDNVRNSLKSNNWRWNPAKKCWYNKETEITKKYARDICKTTPQKGLKKEKAVTKDNKQKFNNTSANEWVDTILNRIRNNDPFKEYTEDGSTCLKLMEHQKAGSIIADKYNRFAFFYDTGTGKTAMALNIISEKYKARGTKFLIIAPKPLIKNAWLDDANRFFPQMRILPLSVNITKDDYKDILNTWSRISGKQVYPRTLLSNNYSKKYLKKKLISNAQHYIVNMDLIRTKENADKLIKETGVTGIVIDESSIIKNYDSKSAQRIRVITKDMDYVYLLSGKPAPNSPLEYFSQMKIVDPQTFSMGFDSFKDYYFTHRGKNSYVIKNQYSERNLTKMVGQRSIIVRKEDCLNLPETTSIKRTIDLDKDTRELYSKVLNNFVTEVVALDGQSTMTRFMGNMARIAKLREIACGFYLDENKRYHISSEKNLALISLLVDEIGTAEQVIIWCNFQFEIETIESELKRRCFSVVTAYGKSKNLDENIQLFKNGQAQYMVAHPKTLKYGVTFTNCHYAVYNSLSYSLEDYYQSHDRIYRMGQAKKCFFYHLLSRESIDELIYKNLSEKRMTTKVFEDLIKKSSKFGVPNSLVDKAISVKPSTIEIATSSINAE